MSGEIVESGGENTRTRLMARIGGLSLHLRGDSHAIARRAREGLHDRFVREAIELEPGLQGRELEKVVRRLKSLHYARLSLKALERRSGRAKTNDGRSEKRREDED